MKEAKKKDKTSFEKRNSNNNLFINNNINNCEIIHNIYDIKPIKRNSFMMKLKTHIEKNKPNLSKKINNNNKNNYIQVNTKRKNDFKKNYDLNKIILIQKYFKNFLTQKIIEKNSMIIFIRKLEKIFLSKKFIQFKKAISKINKKKKRKKTAKKKLLSIKTNIYNTNKISINNTENSKIKEKDSSYCRTTKHNKIMSYINYKLNLIQENNTTSLNTNLNSMKRFIPFSPKIATTDRQGIPLHKIRFNHTIKKLRNNNPKSDKIIEHVNCKTLTNNDIYTDNNAITNTNPNDTRKNITFNSLMDNSNNSKFNNFKSNISKIHKKGLSYNLDIPETSFKNAENNSKELNPPQTLMKNKNLKNARNNAITMEMNKIKKINTLFNNHKKNNNKANNATKTINSKDNENCLYKDKTKKIKNKESKVINVPKSFLQDKTQKPKKELKNKNNKNKKGKLNNKNNTINNIDIKKKYFNYWKENIEKKNILMKFAKFSKFFSHMNHYQKIILLKNTIQNLIKFQKKEGIAELFWKIKEHILINLMKALKDYKIIKNQMNNINTKKNNNINNIDKINQLKIVFSLLEKHKKYLNKINSQSPPGIINYFEKWKQIIFDDKIPKINEKIIDLKTYQTKLINSNNPTNNINSDNPSLKKNLSQSKLSPKIINVINVQNYNQNNNYNYNFKYVPIKDIPIYPIKPRHSYVCSHNNLNANNNNNINNSNNIYHKKKLGNTYINTNYNININKDNIKNCFNKKSDNETNPKFDTYDSSSLILPFQSNNSEIITLEKNNIFYNDEHPEEKFGFKKLEQIEEKEINFLQNTNPNNNINNATLYKRKQNLDKKHIVFKKKSNNSNKVKNSIKILNLQFDNKNEEIIKREKNNLDNKFNKIFSSKNFFTEFNNIENKTKENEYKMNKSFNADMNSTINDDFKITESNFKINSPY